MMNQKPCSKSFWLQIVHLYGYNLQLKLLYPIGFELYLSIEQCCLCPILCVVVASVIAVYIKCLLIVVQSLCVASEGRRDCMLKKLKLKYNNKQYP